MEFKGKKILVVGSGRSGISAARWLAGKEADVLIGDIKGEEELDYGILKPVLDLGIRLELGGHRKETFVNSDMIIVSPGVPLDIAPLVAAKGRGIPVMGEMELAARLFETPIVAITGTNGKSTAVSLLGEMMRASGRRVFLGGNIGIPLMDYVAGDMSADYVVVEVSSFQLDSIEKFQPVLSLLLNISADHLDRYPDFDAYVDSKLRIFQNQEAGHYAILNDDDRRLAGCRPPGKASILRYGMERSESRNAWFEGETLVASLPGREAHRFSTEKFRLPGRHNLENLMGVVLAALVLDLDPGVIGDSIIGFRGLPHRMELIGSIRGIDFYDDSKATNVDAASRSVKSFDRPLILIAGGRDKGGDYGPLVHAARGRLKMAILMGEARELMARAFKGNIPFYMADSMEDAVSQAFHRAEANDVVLLAPACSSFDMFKDYAQRGEIYREQVERLKNGG